MSAEDRDHKFEKRRTSQRKEGACGGLLETTRARQSYTSEREVFPPLERASGSGLSTSTWSTVSNRSTRGGAYPELSDLSFPRRLRAFHVRPSSVNSPKLARVSRESK